MSSLRARIEAFKRQALDATPSYVTPNRISWFRIWAVPLICGASLVVNPLVGFVLYVFAAISDAADGSLARHRGDFSSNGKRLDELTDKAFVFGVIGLLFILGTLSHTKGSWDLWVTVLLAVREMGVSALREFFPRVAKKIPVLPLAKWKTGALMVSLGFLLVSADPLLAPLLPVGQWLYALALVLSVVSGFQYAYYFWKERA